MGLKKQLKKLEDGANDEFAKVRKKLVRTIVGNLSLLVAFLRVVADDDMLTENFVLAVLRNEKLYGLLKHSIMSDLAGTTTPEAVSPTPTFPEITNPESQYIGPPDSQFESGGRVLYQFYLSVGASKNVASGLNLNDITPRKLISMTEQQIMEKRRLGEKAVEFALGLRMKYSKPPTN